MKARHAAAAAPLALALVAILLAGSASAQPQPQPQPRCGETLTYSVRLRANLTRCSGDGLVIGASGITVDLGGHTIDGGGTPADCEFPAVERSGIANSRGFDRLTIVNGTIRGFDNGVAVGSDGAGMSDSRIAGLVVRDNRNFGIRTGSGAGPAATSGNRIEGNVITDAHCIYGILIISGEQNRITGNRIDGAGQGIVVCCDGGRNTVTGNRVTGVGDNGILVFRSVANRIEGNVLTGLGGNGVLILDGVSDTVVRGNSVARAGAGVVIEDESDSRASVRNEIAGNVLTATRDGVVLFQSDSDVVRGNAIAGRTCGDPAECGWGIILDGASETLVSDNVVSGKEGEGIAVGVAPEFNPSSRPVAGNRIARNVVRGQGGNGISVARAARATDVRANTLVGNGADGIAVLAPDPLTTLTANTALGNAGHGIEAAAGVTDGGGNRARGNGTAPQCVGVAC